MKLSIGGIVFLVVAWGVIIGLPVYCFYKVLFKKGKQHED